MKVRVDKTENDGRNVYQFLEAAVTNYYKLGAKKNNRSSFSQFWRSLALRCQLCKLRESMHSLSGPASGGFWHSVICGHFTPLQYLWSCCLFLAVSFLIWTLLTGSRSHQDNVLISKSLTSLHWQRPFFQVRSHSQVPEI